MRICLLIATFALFVGTPSPSPSGQKATDNAQQKAETNKHMAKPSISPAPSTNENSAQNTANQHGGTVKGSENERTVRVVSIPPDYIALVCTVLLTFAGIAGIIVAICTLFKIRDQAIETAKSAKATADSVEAINRQADIMERQTKATEDAAKAALLNAQAVLDSERPWLVVTPVKNEALPGRYYYFFRVTNKGRTPAKLISGSFSQVFLFNADKLPVPAKYDKPFLAPNDRFLPPDGYFDIYRTEDERTRGISPQVVMQSRPSTEILFFYGNIIYDDVLGKNRPGYSVHETRWCFAFFLDGMRFVRTGPDGEADEYNSQT